MPSWLKMVLFLLAGTVCFLAGRWQASHSADATLAADLTAARATIERQEAESLDLKRRLTALKAEFGEISRVDIADYLRLQDEERKFHKVNEILGKVFLLFLNYAAFDAPAEQVAYARRAAGDAGEAPSPAAGNEADPSAGEGDQSVGASEASEDEPPASPAAAVPSRNAAWIDAEAQIAEGNVTLANAGTFLDGAVIPDLRAELKATRPFAKDDPRLAKLQGTYTGTVKFLDPKRKPWTIEIETSASVEDGDGSAGGKAGGLKGESIIRLFEDGTQIGNSRSSGTLSNITNTTSPSAAIILKVGDEKFFQLYYLADADALVGNLYQMTTPGEFALAGRAELRR